jgi:uncharacterized membrane protein YczE
VTSPGLIWTRRIAQLLVGLFLYGAGIAFMVRAEIGVAPWDVLTQGISKQTGLPFGLITNVVGVLVLLLWIPIRQKPGVGTVLNVLLIGPSAQLVLWLVPEQTELWVRIPLFVAGLLVVGVATGLYIGARLGPGPRDGLMTGLHAKIGWPIWVVRTIIEVTVLAIGWALGGNVGIGTVAFALLIGPIANVTLPLLRVPEAAANAGASEPVPTVELGEEVAR